MPGYLWIPLAIVIGIPYLLLAFYGAHVFIHKEVARRGLLQYAGGLALLGAVAGAVVGFDCEAVLLYHHFTVTTDTSHSLWAIFPAAALTMISAALAGVTSLILSAVVSVCLWKGQL